MDVHLNWFSGFVPPNDHHLLPHPPKSQPCRSPLFSMCRLFKCSLSSCHASTWKVSPILENMTISSCPLQVWQPLDPFVSLKGIPGAPTECVKIWFAGPCPQTLLCISRKFPGAADGQGPSVRATIPKKASSGFSHSFIHHLTCPYLHIVPLLLTSTRQFPGEPCALSYSVPYVTRPHPRHSLWLLWQHHLSSCALPC